MLAITSTTEEHVMTDARGKPELPTAFEVLESVVLLITGAVLAAPMLPGFALCVPALAAVAVVLVAPLVAAAALLALAGAILALPYLLVRSIGSIGRRRAALTDARPRWRHAAG